MLKSASIYILKNINNNYAYSIKQERVSSKMYNSYIENGVIIAPNVVAAGEKTTVKYKGLLYNSGADEVYLRLGYGSDWKDQKDVKMTKTSDGFEAQIPITSPDKLNLVFKDSANNWDNNSGTNYSFNIESRS